ncbi:hypothetical protein M758_3G001400 [Ceratodon purpureus]|uniref:Uncharacterized protein n=1 Tax=Ceratodon purpureus TaxID=3225 RepID=A0A8T0IGN0_CERPU|nr:hypothetical protein KC19_3G001200 [Ceratodon purpureus]KAG0621195.1 hypothetical protein M758_3G001400 [Ceratodon purpureus]
MIRDQSHPSVIEKCTVLHRYHALFLAHTIRFIALSRDDYFNIDDLSWMVPISAEFIPRFHALIFASTNRFSVLSNDGLLMIRDQCHYSVKKCTICTLFCS